jgi:NADH:ubiquinone oxidoreductase subunit 5 (subunit L)/multisubunit Na+/H+ antiporter MnhA subunit
MTTATLPLLLLLTGAFVALVGPSRVKVFALGAFPLALITLFVFTSHKGWWRADPIGLFLSVAALVIGGCAVRYAHTQFESERRCSPLVAASILVVAAVVSTDLAANESVLLYSWLATSLSTLLLLGIGAGSMRAKVLIQAAKSFAIGDGALVGVVLSLGALKESLGHLAALSSASGAALLMGAIVAALGRIGVLGRRSWVVETVSTPTSLSALLHAGVVNAGGLLLIREEVITGTRWWVSLLLVAICVAILVVFAPRIHARVDLKGQLAASTVSQMAFMLATLSLGWPLLCLTHLVGHGLYKAGRFMAAGGAIDARHARSVLFRSGKQLSTLSRIAGMVALVVIAAGFGFCVRGDLLAAMGVFAPAGAVIWWEHTKHPVTRAARLYLSLACALCGYGLIILCLQHLLGHTVANTVSLASWWRVGALVGVVALSTLRRRSVSVVASIAQIAIPFVTRSERAAA